MPGQYHPSGSRARNSPPSTDSAWDDAFLIGIDGLDYEHKALIENINRLHEEPARHDDKSQIETCRGDIYARMQAHFALEEHVHEGTRVQVFR
jgi:hemerythrin